MTCFNFISSPSNVQYLIIIKHYYRFFPGVIILKHWLSFPPWIVIYTEVLQIDLLFTFVGILNIKLTTNLIHRFFIYHSYLVTTIKISISTSSRNCYNIDIFRINYQSIHLCGYHFQFESLLYRCSQKLFFNNPARPSEFLYRPTFLS